MYSVSDNVLSQLYIFVLLIRVKQDLCFQPNIIEISNRLTKKRIAVTRIKCVKRYSQPNKSLNYSIILFNEYCWTYAPMCSEYWNNFYCNEIWWNDSKFVTGSWSYVKCHRRKLKSLKNPGYVHAFNSTRFVYPSDNKITPFLLTMFAYSWNES